MSVFVTLVVCFLVSCALTGLLASQRLGRAALDVPNERSLHAAPVPRVGGMVVILVLVLACAWSGFLPLVVLAVVLSVVSFMDDLRDLSPALRLVVHIASAATFLAIYGADVAPVLLPAVALSVVWMTNLFNFMDGSDGLAGGMAVIGFGAYAAAAVMAGAPDVAHLSAVLAAAAAGFVVWNTSPARIFLGDVGSIPLGFLAAALGLLGAQKGAWPYWFPVLVFSPFIVDSTVTLLRRIGRRERFWEPHREHYYQRLVRMGRTQREVAVAAYGLMLVAAGSALAARSAAASSVILLQVFWTIVYGAILRLIDRAWMRHCHGSVPPDSMPDATEGPPAADRPEPTSSRSARTAKPRL